MLTYTIEIQKQKNLLTSTMLSQVAKLNSAYIFILYGVGYVCIYMYMYMYLWTI